MYIIYNIFINSQKVTPNTQLHCKCDLGWEDELKANIRYEIREFQGFGKLKDLFKKCNGSNYLSTIHYYITTILLGLCRESSVRMFFKLSIKPLVHSLLYTSKNNLDYNNIYSILYHNSLIELEYRLSDEYEKDMKLKEHKNVNKNQINFDKKELLYLIYDHLNNNGLKESAKKLLEESHIESLVSELASPHPPPSFSQSLNNNKNEKKKEMLKLIGLKPSPMKRPFSSIASNNNNNKETTLFSTPSTSKKRKISDNPQTTTPFHYIPLNNNINNNKSRLEEVITDYLYDEHMKCPNTGSVYNIYLYIRNSYYLNFHY